MTAVEKEELPELPEGWFWEGKSGPNLDQPPWMARTYECGEIECYATEHGLHIDSLEPASVPFQVIRAVLQANGVSL